jgi:hypothetical protein
VTDGKRETGSLDAVTSNAAGAADAAAAKRRLRGFGTHLVAYFAVMAVLVPVNFFVTPENPWFVLPMVGWGSLLALHAAYAIGLFRVFGGGRR